MMDDSYRWSRDNYSRTRRNVDIWAFILTLRARLTLLDQQWSYPGGFTEDKCEPPPSPPSTPLPPFFAPPTAPFLTLFAC